MLIHPEFVITTPVKTGTESLERTFKDHCIRETPKHDYRGFPFGDRRIYTVIREPRERLQSGYRFLRKTKKTGDGLIGTAVKGSLEDWLRKLKSLRDQEKGQDWRVTQLEYVRGLTSLGNQVTIGYTIWLEDLVKVICRNHGIAELQCRHVNKTRQTTKWTAECEEIVDEPFLQQDDYLRQLFVLNAGHENVWNCKLSGETVSW